MKRTLLGIATSAYIFFYLVYVTTAYLYQLILGPFEAYPPFQTAVYVGPIIAFGFCLCSLLGAIFSLEKIVLLGSRCIHAGTASMAIVSSVFLWVIEAFSPYLDPYRGGSGWLFDIGVHLAPWLVILGICSFGYALFCRLCID